MFKTDLHPAAWAAIGGGGALLISILGDTSNPGNPLKWSEVLGILIAGIPLTAALSNPDTKPVRKIAPLIWVAWLTISAFRTTGQPGQNGSNGVVGDDFPPESHKGYLVPGAVDLHRDRLGPSG
jgi:hypothetical protein